MNELINFHETSFPFNIEKKHSDLKEPLDIGKIKQPIKISLKISKISLKEFILSGNITVTIEKECQSCLDLIEVQLTIDSKVTIKDLSDLTEENKDSDDIHFQNLECFDIEKFIAEEVYLNFPSTVLCSKEECIKEKSYVDKVKYQPFKKIRDLIK